MFQDELEDVVGVVGQTFLGMTVNCARCHDHKFDPVSQKDYYRLASALAGVKHGERSVVTMDQQALRQQRDRVLRDLVRLEAPIRKQLLAEKRKGKVAGPPPLAEWDFTASLKDRAGGLHGKLHGAARQEERGLVLDGQSGYAATTPLNKDLREKTLEAWVRLDNLSQRGGGVFSVQTMDGRTFDAIVFAERNPGRWMAGSNGFVRTQSFAGPIEQEANQRIVHIAVTWAGDGQITAYRDGLPYGKSYARRGRSRSRRGRHRWCSA